MSKVTDNLKFVKESTQGLGGEALQAALMGFENSLSGSDKSAVMQNWAEVKKQTAGLVHAKGFLDGGEGATAEDLERALEAIEAGLGEGAQSASGGGE